LNFEEQLNKSIQDQYQVLEEENKKLKLLESLNLNQNIDEDYFHQLCETPLRNNQEIMCSIVEKIFPMATNFKWSPNYIVCEIKGFKVFVPTSRCYGVNVDIDYIELHPDNSSSFTDPCNKRDIKFLEDYIQLIDSKSSWYQKAQIRNNHRYKKWVLPFWWVLKIIPKDKKENRDRNWYANILNEKLEQQNKRYSFQLDKYQKFTSKWKIYFNEVEPILKSYTDNIYEYEKKNGCCTNFFTKVKEQIDQ